MNAPSDSIALLGLDIGTTSCKVVGYSGEGRRIAQAASGYALSHPQAGHAELDPDDILGAVRQVLTEVAPSLDGFARIALATSAQGEAFVLADAGDMRSPRSRSASTCAGVRRSPR